MDEVDKKILNQLHLDSARAQKEIAEGAGITEPTLSKRVRALRDTGIIKRFSVEIDYDQIGYDTHCMTLISLDQHDQQKRDEVLQKLLAINEVIEVYSVLGNQDYYVRWLCSSPRRVFELLENAILPGVHTQTYVLAREYKREYGPKIE
ncbi:MAG TPA: Lrp/AsnC family transcriptional regulator [Rhizomicrobium sp.]|nr:Lrp/AsnC family transcriptional regulator [Rhizomicrobium sp.]